jgi:antitoxin component YwqK of YwqJK toxin-antitoxin module
MRTLLLQASLLVFNASLMGQAIPDSLGFTDKAEAKNQMENKLKEGKWLETGEGGCDQLTVYKQGKPCGIVRLYRHTDGTLASETPYVNGIKSGIRKTYTADGKLFTETPFINDTCNGIQKWYFPDGKVEAEFPYVNGKKNSIKKAYWENGDTLSITTYKDDIKEGPVKTYYQNGVLQMETNYTNGKENGIEKEYYLNGKRKKATEYANGVPGKITDYDQDGQELR